jgi:hypothetical protein
MALPRDADKAFLRREIALLRAERPGSRPNPESDRRQRSH